MMAIRASHRRLQSRLADLALSTQPVGYPTDPSEVDANFVARLQSLAIASSVTPSRRSTRVRRQLGAVVGAVGILGWAGAAAAGASVGLAATGNLPAPVQNVVADVLDVVNVNIPRPDPTPESGVPAPGSSTTTEDEARPNSTDTQDRLIETDTDESGTPESEISTTSPTSTTTTLPEVSEGNTFTGGVVACNTPAAANNPNCFERIDDDTISLVPSIPACNTPAA